MKRSVSDDDVRDDDDRGKRHRGGGGFRTEIRMLVPSRVLFVSYCIMVWLTLVLLRYVKYCFPSINDVINQNYRDNDTTR